MTREFEEAMEQTIWTAHQLFNRGLVTGSTGNISFRCHDKVYISKSGGCFGRLDEKGFAELSLEGDILEGKPSKEYPIHLSLFKSDRNIGAVVHTHSLYSTAVSCMRDTAGFVKRLFLYTPYLEILTKGNILAVPYYPPGSDELFRAFNATVKEDTGTYLLNNHGLVAAADNAYNAFNIVEEFEVSAKIQHIMTGYKSTEVRMI